MKDLISSFFPPHESAQQPSLVLSNQLKLQPVHHIIVIVIVVAPDQESFMLDVHISVITVFEKLFLLLGCRSLYHSFLFVFELFAFGNSLLKFTSCCFKLFLNVVETDGVEDLLK